MSQEIINIGAAANDGTGDPLRTAFDKVNNNFTQLYTSLSATGPDGAIQFKNTNTLYSTLYVDGTYLVAGAPGRIYYSNDGSVWTSATTGTEEAMYSLAYDGIDTIIAVGASGTILRSNDGGITWSSSTSGVTENLYGAVGYNGSLAVVGANGTILTSHVGGQGYTAIPTVTIAAPANSGGITATATATLANGRVSGFTITQPGLGYTTAPTVTISAPTSGLRATADAVISGGTVTGIDLTSGINWYEPVTGITNTLTGITHGNLNISATATPIYVATGLTGTIVTSTDLVTWSSVTTGSAQDLYSATIDPAISKLIVVGESGTVLTTFDTSIWTTEVSNISATLTSIAHGVVDTITDLIAVGNIGTVIRSNNGGVNWYTAAANTTDNPLFGVAFVSNTSNVSNSSFLAVGSNATVIDSTVTALANAWTLQSVGSALQGDANLLYFPGTQTLSANANIVPGIDSEFSLGTPNLKFSELYLAGNSIHLGTTIITSNANNSITFTQTSNTANLTDLIANNIVVENSSVYGNMNVGEYVLSNNVTAYNLSAGNANIPNLVSNIANANIINANTANIANLTSANANITSLTGGNANLTGNITANYFFGNGAFLTGVSGSNADTGNVTFDNITVQGVNGLNLSAGADFTANSAYLQVRAGDVATHIHFDTGNNAFYDQYIGDDNKYVKLEAGDAGNIIIGTNDGNASAWTFGSDGNLNLPTNGDLNFDGGSIAQTLNEDIYIRASDDESDGWSVYTVVDDGAGNTLSQTRLEFDQYTIRTDAQGAAYTWAFRDTGVLELPGDIAGNAGSNLTVRIGDQAGSNTFIDLQTRSYVGDALISNIRVAPNVTISTSNAAHTWTFDDAGNLTLPANTFAVNYANGVQVPISGGGGNVSQLVNDGNAFVLDADGSVTFEGADPGEGVNRGLEWDYGANANGVNSMIRQDLNGLTVRAWTEDAGNYTAPVNIITGQDANTNTWKFDGQGNLTVPSGSINSIDGVGDLGAYITLTPDLGVRLAGRNALANVGYTNTAWSTATYTGTQIDFTNAPDLVTFFTNNTFNVGVNQTFSINGDEPVPFTGYTTGSSNAVTVYTSVTADPDPTTVTSIDFYYQLESYVAVDYDAGTLNINSTSLTINLDNDQTQGPDINLRSGDDILLQAKDKSLGSESEGGDINIYAGDGASDDGNGNFSSTGGDIQIEAGNGGDGNSNPGSTGGFTTLRGGQGGIAGASDSAGSGGYVAISGGDGGSGNGNSQLGAGGGYVSIAAGASTQEGVNGADVSINSGAGGPNALAGNIEIFTPISDNGPGGTWRFDGQGNLTLPDGIPYIKTSDETSTINIKVSGSANQQSQFSIGSDGGTDQYTYISSQNDANGIASFGLNAYSGVPTSAVINVNNGTVLDWTFTSAALDSTEAYLYTPAGATITTPNATGNETGKPIFIQAGSADQSDFYTSSGGNLYLKGGRGAFNDGGGGGPGGNVYIEAGESADPAGHAGNVYITAGAVTNWTFDYTGNLNLPGNTFAVNYANGTPVTFGNAALGNVTFDDVTVQGVNGLNLSAGPDFTANLAYLQVRAGDVASHIHFDTGNNNAYDLIIGNDQKFVQVSSTGNILMSSYDGNVSYQWNMDITGNLILAGGNSVIQSIANSSLDPTLPNVSTMVFTPDSNYTSQILVLDPTAPGHLHLRTFASSNIDQPNANLFLGGEDTAFEVTSGSGNETRIHSGGNTWEFDNTGNLIIPGSSGGHIKTVANSSIGIAAIDNGTDNPAQLLSINANGTATTAISSYASQATIQANINGDIKTWAFTNTGNLTLPGNTFAVNYANGTQVSLGGYGDSNVATFLASYGSNTISTTGNISVGAVTATGKIGYSTGGNATQSSSGSSVTINQLTGKITMATRTYNDGDLEIFSLQCNKIANDDMVLIQSVDTVDCASFSVSAYPYTLLANTIRVHMRTTGNLGSYTPVLKFLIMKAPIS